MDLLPATPTRVSVLGSHGQGRSTVLKYTAVHAVRRGYKTTFFALGDLKYQDSEKLKEHGVSVSFGGVTPQSAIEAILRAEEGSVFVIDDLNCGWQTLKQCLTLQVMQDLCSAVNFNHGWLVAALLDGYRASTPQLWWGRFFEDHWKMAARMTATHSTGSKIVFPRFGEPLSAWRRLDSRLGWGNPLL